MKKEPNNEQLIQIRNLKFWNIIKYMNACIYIYIYIYVYVYIYIYIYRERERERERERTVKASLFVF